MTFESRFGEQAIAAILKEYESGADRKALCAQHGISVRTLFRWQARAGRSRPALARIVTSLREENESLRRRLDSSDAPDPGRSAVEETSYG